MHHSSRSNPKGARHRQDNALAFQDDSFGNLASCTDSADPSTLVETPPPEPSGPTPAVVASVTSRRTQQSQVARSLGGAGSEGRKEGVQVPSGYPRRHIHGHSLGDEANHPERHVTPGSMIEQPGPSKSGGFWTPLLTSMRF